MFGSLKQENGQNTVTISSIRHLENLAKIDSSKPNIVKAQQVTDISFTAYQKNMASFFNNSKPELYIYQPVNLKSSLSYDAGYSDSKNISHQYMLSDLEIEAKVGEYHVSTSGGVFGSLASEKTLSVSNLQFVDINVKASGNENAGALLGSAKDKTTVYTDNVLVWDKSATIGISAEADAGGLIGHSDGNVIIKNTAVSAYVKSTGGNAGGLIGSAFSLNVSSSYVSAHTYQKDYVTDVNPQTDKASQHYNIIAKKNAGGIAGTVTTLKGITNSYVTASVSGSTAYAFVGSVSKNSSITKDGSYAVTVVKGTNVKEPSSFTGKADTDTKYVNDKSLLDGNETVTYPYTVVSSLDNNAKAWFLKTHVGDWQGASQNNATVSFNNDEILQLIASVPNVRSDDEVEVQFFYQQDKFGQADLSKSPTKGFFFKGGKFEGIKDFNNYEYKDPKFRTEESWKGALCKVKTDGNVTNYTINIDDITYYKDEHRGNFSSVINNGYRIGYDVTARVLVNGTVVSDPVVTNSLYDTNSTEGRAIISCGRHLQNLSLLVNESQSSWKEKSKISNIVLMSDITWNSRDNSFFDRVKKLRVDPTDTVSGVYINDNNTLVANKKFYPIDGYNVLTSNSSSGFEGYGHVISDISFSEVGDCSGLFGSIQISGFKVQNLTINNGMIEADGNIKNAGIIAGRFYDGTLSHCFVTGEDSYVRIGTTGDAGGIVGYLQNATVSNCGASAYVQGGNAGGLVGDFNSGSITRSFSGGRTASGSYLQDAKNKGYYNVEGYKNAGGLVGISGGTISNSYSSSSVFGGTKSDDQKNQWSYTTGSVNVGGLIGNTWVSQPDASYAAGMVQGPKGTTGSLIGSYNTSVNDENKVSYYLEGINSFLEKRQPVYMRTRAEYVQISRRRA